MEQEIVPGRACLGLAAMAIGLVFIAIGLLLWTGASLNKEPVGPIEVGIPVLGAILFAAGAAVELRSRWNSRYRR